MFNLYFPVGSSMSNKPGESVSQSQHSSPSSNGSSCISSDMFSRGNKETDFWKIRTGDRVTKCRKEYCLSFNNYLQRVEYLENSDGLSPKATGVVFALLTSKPEALFRMAMRRAADPWRPRRLPFNINLIGARLDA